MTTFLLVFDKSGLTAATGNFFAGKLNSDGH